MATGKFLKEYITKENINFATQLAQKAYYSKIIPLLEKGIKAGDISIVREKIEKMYDDLPDTRKVLITPAWVSVKEKMRRWNSESSEPYMKYKENLIHETDRGEFVRSKSEKDIANELNYHSNRLDYKYERPLTVISHGHEEIFHPDFTVINRVTGNIKYWEHAGKMDDPGYVNHFVGKLNTYIENGIFPGEDLIVTYETSSIPLNKRNIRAWIEKI